MVSFTKPGSLTSSHPIKGVFTPLEEPNPDKPGLIARLVRWLRNKIGLGNATNRLLQVIDESEERGFIDEEEGEMIEGIFDLRQTVAREIMIPRTHIVSLPITADLRDTLRVIVDSGYSRIPVYQDNVDQVLGMLTAKDLLPLWLDETEEFKLASMLREVMFVPETKNVKQLLEEMKSRNFHMAIVVDEFGGTSGIVTLEDILEEIIGEIWDEHDVEEDEFILMEDGSVLTSARTNIDDFEERFKVEIPRNGYDTIGGFIIHLMGKVPSRGEEMDYKGLRIRVHGGDRKSITRILVINTPDGQEPPSNQSENTPIS